MKTCHLLFYLKHSDNVGWDLLGLPGNYNFMKAVESNGLHWRLLYYNELYHALLEVCEACNVGTIEATKSLFLQDLQLCIVGF